MHLQLGFRSLILVLLKIVFKLEVPRESDAFYKGAGRSGHQPGATSTIHFLPTHGMELIEALALQNAIKKQIIEDRIPYLKTFDVAIQFLMTLAIADGFYPKSLFEIIQNTFCFQELSKEEWQWMLNFLIQGSPKPTSL